jgi:predicted ATPase
VTRRELVVRRPEASLDGMHEYAFHHQLLHQVTYDTVLKRLRRAYHARAAAWLAGLSGARANDYLGVAAEHFEKAGETLRACEFFTRAAEHAAARYAHETVGDLVARALALIDDDAEPALLRLRWRLLAVRERALDLQGLRSAHEADIVAMQALAEVLDDDHLRADAAKRHSYLAMRKFDTPTQIGAARRAMAYAERSGSIELKLRAQNLLAAGLCEQGDVDTGRALALDGLAAARTDGLRRVEGSFLNTLALIAVRLDDFAMHLEMAQQQWLVLRELGDRPAEAVARLHVGISLLTGGDSKLSRSHLEEGLRLARAAGDRVMEPYGQTYLAMIALREGQPDAAMTLAQTALATSLEVGNVETQITALLQIAEIELAAGRSDAAAAAFEQAQAIAVEHDEPLRFDAAAGLARVALAHGDGAAALLALQPVLDHLAVGGTLDGTESRQRIRLTCHQALAGAGDTRAAGILGAAYADLQRQAQGIADVALRQHFLHDVPEHREIAAAWAAGSVRPGTC